MSNYYETLGVGRDAQQKDIKKAYRDLSKKYHPDHNQDDKESEDKFKEINEAYSVLSNEEKRNKYDNPSPFGGLFNMGGFNPFERMRPGPRKPDFDTQKNGSFLGIEVIIPLRIFIFGGDHTVTTNYFENCVGCNGNGFVVGDSVEKCSACGGSGSVQHVERHGGFQSVSVVPCVKCRGTGLENTDRCLACNGSGNIHVKNKDFLFNIPSGVEIGTKIILNGAGRTGTNGGRNGDVGIMIMGIESVDVSKFTSEQIEQLKSII